MRTASKSLRIITAVIIASLLFIGAIPVALADPGDEYLSDISVTNAQLSPAFLPGVFEYQLTLDTGYTSSTLTVTLADPTSNITINGVADSSVTLGLEETDIHQATVTVVSLDGQRSATYTINIIPATEVTEYTVLFDSQGGSDVPSDKAAAGETVAEPEAPTKEGYTFAGWYADLGLSMLYNFSDVMPDHDITLYAAWNLNNYTVTYDANGAVSGTVPVDANTYHLGDPVAVLDNVGTLEKTGALFSGWNTKEDGSGISYTAIDTFTMPASDATLYALWQETYGSHDAAKIKAFLVQDSDVSGKTNAEVLGYNPDDPSTWLDVTWDLTGGSGRVQSITWDERSLAGTLDLSSCTSLQELYLYDNSITSLNVSGCSALEYLDSSYNLMSLLNASGLSKLFVLDCSYNTLQDLSLSDDLALAYLDCSNNQLTSQDLSGLSSLDLVFCGANALTSLNLAGCGALEVLDCNGNALSSLNLEDSSNLIAVDCNNNKLTSLNISSDSLIYLDCSKNMLKSVSAYVNGNPVTLTASGSGYVELSYDSVVGEQKAIASPAAPSVFGNWTKSGVNVSSSASINLTSGGEYTANFGQARKGTVVNCTSAVNVRSGPGTNYSVLGSAKRGAIYTVTGQSGSWYKIDYNGRTGYISANYLSVSASGGQNPPASQTGTVVNCNSAVNVRSGPGTSYSLLGTAPKGTVYTVTGQSGSWYKIDYNGKTGYISASYLSVTSAPPDPMPAKTGTVVNCTSGVNVRSGPGTSYLKLGVAPKGTTYTVTGQTGSWYKIDFGGKTGYISASYLAVNNG